MSYDELTTAGLVGRFLKGRLTTDRINAIGVADYADRSPEQITALIRANTDPHGLTGGFGGRIALTDGMIHQQDIRRSIGLPRTIDPERLRTALDFARFAPTIRGAWRARGVRLVATDLDWSYGKGRRGTWHRRGAVDGDGRARGPRWTTSTGPAKPNSPSIFEPSPSVRLLSDLLGVRVQQPYFRRVHYTAARPVTGGRSFSVTMPGLAATTMGTALVTGRAV